MSGWFEFSPEEVAHRRVGWSAGKPPRGPVTGLGQGQLGEGEGGGFRGSAPWPGSRGAGAVGGAPGQPCEGAETVWQNVHACGLDLRQPAAGAGGPEVGHWAVKSASNLSTASDKLGASDNSLLHG